jgi:ribose transport system substrate-binding protein
VRISLRGRKAAFLAALLALAIPLAACGKTEDSGDEQGAAAPVQSADGGGAVGDAAGDLEQLPTDTAELCGEEPLRIALVDGFGGNSWRKIVRAELDDELKDCDNVEEVSYSQAGGDIQKYNSAVNSFAAQGYDIILTYDDFGSQALPALRKAQQSGVVVVPYITDVGGTAGEDYAANILTDIDTAGQQLSEWVDKQIGGSGNVLLMGGVPGNPTSQHWLKATMSTTAPGIRWLQDKPVDTNWDPAQYQRVTSGLISKYPKIDAIFSDYGAGSAAEVRAFISAGKPHPPLATSAASNELGCLYQQQKAKWPDFQMIWIDGTTRVVRWAARRALATVNDIELSDPTTVKMYPFVDTTAGREPACRRDLPPDADLSSGLDEEELAALFQ